MSNWKWTKPKELAATLAADGQLDNQEIGQRCDVNASTFERWRHAPEFQSRVAEHLEAYRATIAKQYYKEKDNRVADRHQQIERLKRVIAARAKAHAFETVIDPATKRKKKVPVPGGDTGLLVREIRYGEPVYLFDAALDAAYRAHLVEIATEVGDWKQKMEHAGPDGGPIKREITIRFIKPGDVDSTDQA